MNHLLVCRIFSWCNCLRKALARSFRPAWDSFWSLIFLWRRKCNWPGSRPEKKYITWSCSAFLCHLFDIFHLVDDRGWPLRSCSHRESGIIFLLKSHLRGFCRPSMYKQKNAGPSPLSGLWTMSSFRRNRYSGFWIFPVGSVWLWRVEACVPLRIPAVCLHLILKFWSCAQYG